MTPPNPAAERSYTTEISITPANSIVLFTPLTPRSLTAYGLGAVAAFHIAYMEIPRRGRLPIAAAGGPTAIVLIGEPRIGQARLAGQ